MNASALKLWEVGDELALIAAEIMEAEGELTPELEARLEAMEGTLMDRVERIALKIRELQANAEAAKYEADRLLKIQRSFGNAADRLKGYLQFCLVRMRESTGQDRVVTPRAKVRIQRNSRPSIRWSGEPEDAPESYRRVRVEVDTQAAYEELKAGSLLPDGFEVEWGEHIRIY